MHVHGDIGGFKELKDYNSIVTFHGFTEDAVKNRNILIKLFLYFASIRYEKGNIRYCNNLIAVSKNVKNKKKFYTKKKVTVIYNGINTNVYKNVSEKEKIRLKHSLNFRKDTRYILFIGKDKYIKGLDIAINAIKKIKNNIHLNVIGLVGRNDEYVSYLGQIFSNKKINYIKCSDVLIAPSRYDAFPISTLEAMGSGIPIIISNNVGVKELIKNNYNGIVVNKNEPIYYTEELNKLLNNKSYYRKLSKKARITAIKNNKDVMLCKYDKIYKKVLKF
ncbi:MAG: glycosyltransferase family 4 protein [Candidatus Marsarchaeota archaeon]|nr:glycosyltransferase family 4 protein [Candidatus Marsarchaeota archaeon]